MKELSLRILRGLGKLLLGFLKFLLVLLALSAAWIMWDIHKLRAFCGEVRPGQTLVEFRATGERHGIAPRWLDKKIPDPAGGWLTYIPAPATMGDMVCAVRHDGEKVLSAKVLEE